RAREGRKNHPSDDSSAEPRSLSIDGQPRGRRAGGERPNAGASGLLRAGLSGVDPILQSGQKTLRGAFAGRGASRSRRGASLGVAGTLPDVGTQAAFRRAARRSWSPPRLERTGITERSLDTAASAGADSTSSHAQGTRRLE